MSISIAIPPRNLPCGVLPDGCTSAEVPGGRPRRTALTAVLVALLLAGCGSVTLVPGPKLTETLAVGTRVACLCVNQLSAKGCYCAALEEGGPDLSGGLITCVVGSCPWEVMEADRHLPCAFDDECDFGTLCVQGVCVKVEETGGGG